MSATFGQPTAWQRLGRDLSHPNVCRLYDIGEVGGQLFISIPAFFQSAIGYADGMTAHLDAKKIRIFDYPRFAEPFRDVIRADTNMVAAAAGVTIEFIRKVRGFRKEELIQKIIAERGSHPGLVHIFSAMEACMSYKSWHNKVTGQTFLRYEQ